MNFKPGQLVKVSAPGAKANRIGQVCGRVVDRRTGKEQVAVDFEPCPPGETWGTTPKTIYAIDMQDLERVK
jgi:hypothetical protein